MRPALGLLVALLGPPPNDAAADSPAVTLGPGLVDVTAADDRFRLQLGLFGQMQLTTRHDEGTRETEAALEVRRARLKATGHTFGVHNKYFVQLAFSPKDLQLVDGRPTKSPIFDWILTFDHLRDLSVRVGQYRVPFSRQRRVAIGSLALVDRSVVNAEFNLDRDVGFDVFSDDIAGLDRLRYSVGVFTGEGRDAYTLDAARLLYVGRFEVLPFGVFEDYDETDWSREPRPRVALGAAYAFVDHAARDRGVLGTAPVDGGTTDIHAVTGDIVLRSAGVTLLAEAHWRRGRRNLGRLTVADPDTGVELPAPGLPARNGTGWFAQASWLLPRGIPVELAARYGQVLPGEVATSLGRREELGAGVQWFVHGTALEVVVDAFHEYPQGRFDSGTDTVRVLLELGL